MKLIIIVGVICLLLLAVLVPLSRQTETYQLTSGVLVEMKTQTAMVASLVSLLVFSAGSIIVVFGLLLRLGEKTSVSSLPSNTPKFRTLLKKISREGPQPCGSLCHGKLDTGTLRGNTVIECNQCGRTIPL